jgi:hypothetical protein
VFTPLTGRSFYISQLDDSSEKLKSIDHPVSQFYANLTSRVHFSYKRLLKNCSQLGAASRIIINAFWILKVNAIFSSTDPFFSAPGDAI